MGLTVVKLSLSQLRTEDVVLAFPRDLECLVFAVNCSLESAGCKEALTGVVSQKRSGRFLRRICDDCSLIRRQFHCFFRVYRYESLAMLQTRITLILLLWCGHVGRPCECEAGWRCGLGELSLFISCGDVECSAEVGVLGERPYHIKVLKRTNDIITSW